MSDLEFLSPAARVSMADEWFQFATPDHFWMKWRHRVLLQQLSRLDRPIGSALEIGCGHGVVREMVERDLAIPVDGCDLNQTALEMAKKGRGRLLVYDIFDQNAGMMGAYDMILLMDVIEHIEDDEAFLMASLKSLKPQGIVVINVPASMSLYSKYDKVAGHIRRYDKAGIEALFKAANVKAIAIVPWGFSLIPVLMVRKLVVSFVSTENTIRTGFAPPNFVTRAVMEGLQKIETRMPFSMPRGTSLLAVGQAE